MDLCIYGCGKTGVIKNKSNLGWRCATSPNSCPAVKLSKKQSVFERYGVENISKCPEILKKKKSTWLKNYGVDNPSKADINKQKIKNAWPDIKKKRAETSLKKFGVDSFSKTEEFQTKRKQTWLEKYGVDNPTKNLEIAHKVAVSNEKSDYRTKTLVLPSGKTIRYQGYEDQVINDLLKSGLKEEDIVTGPANVPHIYYEFDDKICRYYPDIYIPRYNLIIEVKSKYTWKKYKTKNLAKRHACKLAGYFYNIVIK